MPLELSTETSPVIYETQGGSGTNVRAGEETTSHWPKRSSKETKLQPASKPDSPAQDPDKSIKLFTWKDELGPSSCSAEEEADKAVVESKAYQEVIAHEAHETQSKKKQKRTHSPYVLTPEHVEYRRLLDAHEKWDKELMTKHGLSEAEAGLVSDIVAKYGNAQHIPSEDPEENSKVLELARPGWEQFQSITTCFQKHVLPTGWLHKKNAETGEWTVVKIGAH